MSRFLLGPDLGKSVTKLHRRLFRSRSNTALNSRNGNNRHHQRAQDQQAKITPTLFAQSLAPWK